MTNPEVTCEACAACCSNVRLALTGDEATRLQTAGTDLETILPPLEGMVLEGLQLNADEAELSWADGVSEIREKAFEEEDIEQKVFWLKIANDATQLNPGEGMFAMLGPCGNLQDDGMCGDYENRPNICRTFTMGGEVCRVFRQKAGVDVSVELTSKQVSAQ